MFWEALIGTAAAFAVAGTIFAAVYMVVWLATGRRTKVVRSKHREPWGMPDWVSEDRRVRKW